MFTLIQGLSPSTEVTDVTADAQTKKTGVARNAGSFSSGHV